MSCEDNKDFEQKCKSNPYSNECIACTMFIWKGKHPYNCSNQKTTSRCKDPTGTAELNCCEWTGPPPPPTMVPTKPGPPPKPGPGSPGASSKSSLSVGTIVGLSIGGLFLLIAIILGIKFLSEKKKGGKKSK